MRIEPKKIMCAIDFSDFSTHILAYGKLLAKEYGSKLFLCHIVPESINVSGHLPSYFNYMGIETELIDNAHRELAKMVQDLDLECEIMVCSGHPAYQIERLAHEQQIDMVIVATHSTSGIKRFLIGSVTDRLVKVLNCPLLILQGGAQTSVSLFDKTVKLKKILVGCDFSEDSKLAFDYALSLAQEFQIQIHLAHVIRPAEQFRMYNDLDTNVQETYSGVWDRLMYPGIDKQQRVKDPGESSSISDYLKIQLMEMVSKESLNWCTPVTSILEGQAYKELINYANQEQIDMIVLGIRGHSFLEQFLVGSTTDRIISQAPCPVLAVRHTVM